MTPERFDTWCTVTHGHQPSTNPNGAYVRYEDYVALQEQASRAERRGAERALRSSWIGFYAHPGEYDEFINRSLKELGL